MIDLQLHTTDSDGTWPWDKVLNECLKLGLKAFAITDHDTTMRRAEILAWAKANNAEAIPGIELSTTEKGQTVHLLGYFLDGKLERLQARLDYLKQGRLDRNRKIIQKLQNIGVEITEQEVLDLAGRGTIGRPHVARLLVQKGKVKSMQAAFDKYLAQGGQAYFPKDELPLKEGIELLHEAGAVTSVAHPGLLKRSAEDLEVSMKEWRGWGLDGIEAVYPNYNAQQVAYFDRAATKYGFLKTGGSDFHGENKPHIRIGVGTGALKVPDEFLEPLFQRRAELN